MERRSQGKSTLLRLPAEVRLRILRLSICEHVFKVDTMKELKSTLPRIVFSHIHDTCCKGRAACRLSALPATCRLLFREANEVLYSQIDMIFSSMEAVHSFYQDRIPILRHVRQITVLCGPMKHLSPSLKLHTRLTMRLIQRCAYNLATLRLCFSSYHGIHCDQQLLSNFWFHNLSRLRGLKQFAIDVELDVLGPVGIVCTSDEGLREQTQRKMSCTEGALRTRICRPRCEPQSQSKIAVQELRHEILKSMRGRTLSDVKSYDMPIAEPTQSLRKIRERDQENDTAAFVTWRDSEDARDGAR